MTNEFDLVAAYRREADCAKRLHGFQHQERHLAKMDDLWIAMTDEQRRRCESIWPSPFSAPQTNPEEPLSEAECREIEAEFEMYECPYTVEDRKLTLGMAVPSAFLTMDPSIGTVSAEAAPLPADDE